MPAAVDQIGDGTWALFPQRVFLKGGETYTGARGGRTSAASAATARAAPLEWRFTHRAGGRCGSGDTRVPRGSRRGQAGR